MRKIGIFAIGALLFTVVSCNKNKTSLAPDPNYTSSKQSIEVPPKDFHNENEFPTTYNPNKEAGPRSIRNENEFPTIFNPNKEVAPKTIHNENEFPTTSILEKTIKGVRNDEVINTNTSDL